MKAEINNVIAFCHIMDDFENFIERLSERLSLVISNKSSVARFAFALGEISRGNLNYILAKSNYKEELNFYNENKSIIDTINKYSNITKFIHSCFLSDGILYIGMHDVCKYIYDHKDEKEKILAVLEKLKELGFHEFEFIELDFTKKTYYAHPSLRLNAQFVYVANPQDISNDPYSMFYKTTDSNYSITFTRTGENIHADKLILNSLVFDPNSLPKSLSVEDTFDCILNSHEKHLEQLKQSKQSEQSDDLTTCVSDLKEQVNSSIRIINELDVAKNKEKLIEVTANIRNNIEKLKTLGKGTKVIVRKKNR